MDTGTRSVYDGRAMPVADISTLHKANPELVQELENLLTEARSGNLRGMLFVAYRNATDTKRYGNAGEYSLADFALAIKLMELEFDSIVSHQQELD